MKKNDVKQSEELKKLFSEETLNSMEMARVYGGGEEDSIEEGAIDPKGTGCQTPKNNTCGGIIKGGVL